MTPIKSKKSIALWIVSVVAVLFGLLTIKSGGSVIFFDGIARENAGNYVPFVIWFNFLAGFVYILTGLGLFMQKRWAAKLSIIVVLATIVIFILFGLHILNGGLYETRTVGAMSMRTIVWTLIATYSYKKFLHTSL